VNHFRKCQWLGANEFKQLIPRHAVRRHAGAYLWEAIQTDLTGGNSIAINHRVALNKTARKYGITSPLRLACFYGNALQETQWLQLLSEGDGQGKWYFPWCGRGFLQLTHPQNYVDYWRFRGRHVADGLRAALIAAGVTRNNANLRDNLFAQLTQQMCGWREEVRGVQLQGSKDGLYAPADSAGFYWTMLKMASYADSDHALERVPIQTNGGPKVV
jgi:predicted chitinase